MASTELRDQLDTLAGQLAADGHSWTPTQREIYHLANREDASDDQLRGALAELRQALGEPPASGGSAGDWDLTMEHTEMHAEIRVFQDSGARILIWHVPAWRGRWGVTWAVCAECARSFLVVHPAEGDGPLPCPYECGGHGRWLRPEELQARQLPDPRDG